MNHDLKDPRILARSCAAILLEKKVNDLQIFDVGDSLAITDYFVIGTGMNTRHLKTVTVHLERFLKENGLACRGVEGYQGGSWVLLDLGDVIVHLFLEETRKFYDLELLWGDSPRLEFDESEHKRQAAH